MTYEYLCTACGHHWEAEQSISASPLKTCPSCSQDCAKRQVSGGAGFILKGGGWYADLYSSAKPEKKEAAKSESSTTATPASSGGESSASTTATSTTSTTSTPGASSSTASAPSTKQGGASAT